MSEDLKEKLEDYKKLVEDLPIGVFSVDLNGNFLKSNEECRKILGFKNITETKQGNFFSFFPSIEIKDKFVSKLKTNRSQKIEIESFVNERIFFEIHAKLCKELDCIQGSILDITDKKLLEEACKNNLDKINSQMKTRISQLDSGK